MTDATIATTDIVRGLYKIWAATLPQMDQDDFDHEAGHVAYQNPDSAGLQFMRDAVDTERRRRAGAS